MRFRKINLTMMNDELKNIIKENVDSRLLVYVKKIFVYFYIVHMMCAPKKECRHETQLFFHRLCCAFPRQLPRPSSAASLCLAARCLSLEVPEDYFSVKGLIIHKKGPAFFEHRWFLEVVHWNLCQLFQLEYQTQRGEKGFWLMEVLSKAFRFDGLDLFWQE